MSNENDLIPTKEVTQSNNNEEYHDTTKDTEYHTIKNYKIIYSIFFKY
ncbi:hypothetical protein J5751_01350 [bacterium]|nr:hypothetical protein [bacterium]